MQVPGLVNVDFADVRAIMANAGSSLMGIGTATGTFKNLLRLKFVVSMSECTFSFSASAFSTSNPNLLLLQPATVLFLLLDMISVLFHLLINVNGGF